MRELSLNVMDVAQNSISAGATLITLGVEECAQSGTMVITVADNGRGMSAEQLAQVQSPFYTTRTTRPVGLGVPLFKMAAEMTGGRFSIQSALGKGTEVRAEFHTGHIDMMPLGNMSETVLLLISCNPDIDFVYRRTQGEPSEEPPGNTAPSKTGEKRSFTGEKRSFTGEKRSFTGEKRSFTLDTRELREVLGGDVALNNPEVVAWIREFLAEQDNATKA